MGRWDPRGLMLGFETAHGLRSLVLRISTPLGPPTPGSYRFSSLTLKGLERRLDGLFELERFRGLTAKEVWAMLNLVTPIQETTAYQSIFAEGEAKGRDDDLKRLLRRRFDILPAWAEQRIYTASIAQLDAWLDGIFDAQSLEALIGSAPN